jgi:hypothetical protein
MPSNMAWSFSEMSENLSESKIVSAVAQAQECVRTIAGAEPGDTVMRQLDRASRRIPFWKWSRVKDAWYAEKRMRVDADELARLRELAAKYGARNQVEAIEPSSIEERLRRIEAALRLSDSDAYRALIGEGRPAQN